MVFYSVRVELVEPPFDLDPSQSFQAAVTARGKTDPMEWYNPWAAGLGPLIVDFAS